MAIPLALTSSGGEGKPRPALPLLRGADAQVDADLRPLAETIARRVERIRGLRFRSIPQVQVVGGLRLTRLGERLADRQRARASRHPARFRASRRLNRAAVRFDQLAGLLPPEFSFGPDARPGLDRVGGAYDYSRRQIVLVPELIQTRDQLEYTLAHELAHALEGQHFRLHLGTLTHPGEATSVRRAVIEGTASFVQGRYRQRYLNDRVPLAQRLEGMRSVIGAAPGAYAVNAEAIFDYVDGGLFARDLYRRAGGWRLVDRALEDPPRRSDQLLHPRRWPEPDEASPIRLGIGPAMETRWRRVGGGLAGEEQALVILLAGTISSEAVTGAAGWDGGRFAVWRSRSSEACNGECAGSDLGVIAFRWRRPRDAEQFSLAVPAYMIAGRLAERVDERTWKVGDGYASLATADRGSALAFAPVPALSDSLSRRAAASAAVRGRRNQGK